MDKFDLKKYLAEGRLLNENQKINTNVYYVDEYQDFYHEAVPEYEIDDVEDMLSNRKNHIYIKSGTEGNYDGRLFTTKDGSDTRVSPEYIGEGGVLKEGLFDRRKVINWLKSNHKYDMTNDPNADYDYELGDPDDGNRVRVEKDGIFVNIEGGISNKISFSEFKKYFINENELVKENKGEDIDDLFNAIQSRLKNQNKINENIADVIAITGILSGIFGLMVAGFIDTTDEGDQIKEWFKTKVLPKIKKIIGSDRKIKSILSKLKNNPEAMEAITNAKRGDFRRTVRKFLTDDEYYYFDRITRDQIKSGEATDYQLRSINLLGKKKEEYKILFIFS